MSRDDLPDGLTGSVLRQVETLGYAVSVHRMGEYVELHAVPLDGEPPIHMSRCDGDGDDELYLAA